MDEQSGSSVYRVGGQDYRLEPLSWQQNKWLADHVFKNIDLQRLDYATIWDLFREQGPLIMAISLVSHSMTRTDHSKQSFSTISSRAEQFAAELTGGEVAKFAPYFFQSCRPDQLAMLMPGKVLQQMAKQQAEDGKPSAAHGATTSSGVSSPSAEATLPSSPSSSVNGDHASPSPISVAASNGSTLITPSSASAG